MDAKSVKFSNHRIFLQNDFKKNIKKSRVLEYKAVVSKLSRKRTPTTKLRS
jgi:hypothetical protein